MAKIQITIEFDQETGQLQLHGPINDKILSYGLLEMAREIISKQEVKQSNIISPVLQFPQVKKAN